MSISALLLGVEARLRSEAVLNDQPSEEIGKFVGVQPDGKPPNLAGQFYYAVHFLGARPEDVNALSSDWFFDVGVTLTARLNYAPKDRRGKRITFAQDLLDRAIAVAAVLHQDDLHRIEANKLIEGTAEYVAIHGGSETVDGFLEPLRLALIGESKPAPPGWVGAQGVSQVRDGVVSSGTQDIYTVAVRFRDARRTQVL